MQGLKGIIPTDLKIKYINQLLRVGFDTIDFGSFVSPRAIRQMADTRDVLDGLDLNSSRTRLLAIVANVRGATDALEFDEIDYLGYPMSISETFQQRNTNRSISEGLDDLAEIVELAEGNEREVVAYISMGFGNPYGDPYDDSVVEEYCLKLSDLGISIISVADTVGTSTPESIERVFSTLIPKFPHLEIGAHLHSSMEMTRDKVHATYKVGCRRMDGAINGFGGCPMAEDKLVGNMATETIISYLEEYRHEISIDHGEFEKALNMAPSVFLGR